MRFQKRLVVVCGLLISSAVTGCSGGAGPVVPTFADETNGHTASGAYRPRNGSNADRASVRAHALLQRSWVDRAALDRVLHRRDISTASVHEYLVAASDDGNGAVDLYEYQPLSTNLTLIGQIALPYPVGLAVDSSANIFAASLYGTITEYSPASAYMQPILTIPDANNPQGVAVGPDGTVYVANNGPFNESTGANSGGNITEYKKGSATPFATLTLPNSVTPEYVAVDDKSDLYAQYTAGADGTFMGEFPAGSATFEPFILSNETYDAQLDTNGNLLAEDPTTGNVYTYRNGTALGTNPISITNAGFGYFNLDFARNLLFATGETNFSQLDEYGYPGGSLDETIAAPSDGNFVEGVVSYPITYPPPYSPIPTVQD